VTISGCAFASEQFAALLIMEAPDAFRSELIGVEKLPKKSGSLRCTGSTARELPPAIRLLHARATLGSPWSGPE